LGAASPPIIISLGGIVGRALSPDSALGTLPFSLRNPGPAPGAIPAAIVTRHFGRRTGYRSGAGIGIIAASLRHWAPSLRRS